MKIKKIDISSIFPIIIKIIKLILDVVSKLAKFKIFISNNSELTVLVKVRIESLKDFSNEEFNNSTCSNTISFEL